MRPLMQANTSTITMSGEWQLFVPDAASHVDTPGAPAGEPGKYQYITVNRSGDVYPTQQDHDTLRS